MTQTNFVSITTQTTTASLITSLLITTSLISNADDLDHQRAINAGSDQHNWLLHGHDYAEQRHSPLTQINQHTVADLSLAWSFDDHTNRALEATLIVVDGIMYVSGTWSMVYAINAKTGEKLWQFDPPVPRELAGRFCCDVINRGVAMWQGKVFVGTLDGRLIAIDADSGEQIWQVLTVDQSKPYSITGAPRIVKNKVGVGNGSAKYGVRGYISAYDTDTAKQLWRFLPPANGLESDTMAMAA